MPITLSNYKYLNEKIASNKYSSLFILCDYNTNEHCVHHVLSQLETTLKIEILEIEAGEELKNITTCSEIWSILADYGADKKSLIINVGGGVITDLGGFVATTFKRGIAFVNIPTSLLGMVDASFGGKNGVDLGNLKNQIGTICNPELVLIDTDFLETLPKNQLISGFAEMLKHGLICDLEYWKNCAAADINNIESIIKLIPRSIEIKNEIVIQDPTEKGIRKALNFGHTLGHAIESYFLETENSLLHGEAIAIGMVLESFISLQKGLLSEQSYLEIKKVLKSIYKFVDFTETDIESIITLLIHDKKNEYGTVQFALLDGIGKVRLNQLVENQIIKDAFENYKID